MKRFFFILFVLLNLLTVSSDPIRDNPGGNGVYNFSLVPYTGGMGINLGSLYYPRHNSNGSVTWKRWNGRNDDAVQNSVGTDFNNSGDIDENERNYDLGTPNGQYSEFYTDYHIIAIGGAYNIPFGTNGYNNRNSYSNIASELELPSNGLEIDKDSIKLSVTATCDSDFEFVSQSNPIYRRPFNIEIIPRVSVGGQIITEYIRTLGPSENIVTIEVPDSVADNSVISMIAADMVIVLPYDYSKYSSDGGYFSGGLTYNNATYTLADLSDYTAVVTLEVTISFNYSYIQNYQEVNSSYSDTRVMTIPFSGYYSSSDFQDKLEESISLFVSPTSEAANLNLENQGQWITVGNLNFLYVGGTNIPGTPNANDDIVSIFLSASPYPDVQSSSSFRMVHEEATDIITNRNSLGFDARIVGSGSDYNDISLSTNGSNSVEFDGLAFTGNIMHRNNAGDLEGEKDVVATLCNYGYLSNVPTSRHFHTFEGDIQIRFNNSQMLNAGIYRSYIYVHAVTEE